MSLQSDLQALCNACVCESVAVDNALNEFLSEQIAWVIHHDSRMQVRKGEVKFLLVLEVFKLNIVVKLMQCIYC